MPALRPARLAPGGTRPFLLAALLVGLPACGPGGPQGVMSASHGGTMVELPEGRGYAEVVRGGAGAPNRISVYFLDKDRRPVSPPPASATLKLKGARGGKPVELKPSAADPQALESPDLPEGEVDGELTAELAGKPVTIPIEAR